MDEDRIAGMWLGSALRRDSTEYWSIAKSAALALSISIAITAGYALLYFLALWAFPLGP
jgi:hypothetical protein